MAMILDAVMKKCSTFLVDTAFEEATVVLGVKDEVQKLLLKMESIRCLLEDAEKKKFNDSSIHFWLSQLKDFMYDADDIIDLCMIKGNQLLADDENSENDIFLRLCCNFFSILSSISSFCLRYRIGKRIKDLNVRLQKIDENRRQFNLQRSETHHITLVNPRQTSPMIDPLVVRGELEVATNELVDLLIAEKAEEKFRLFAVAGMGGIGKTTLAQKIFNHPKIQDCFNSKVWVCVSQTYNEIQLLKRVIRGVNGHYDNDMTKEELLPILGNYVASAPSLFLVLDDVWRADVWLDLLRIPLQTTNSSVRVLVTTRYADDVAKVMQAAHIHNVKGLSKDASWDMLRRLLFKDHHEEQQQADELMELGLKILKNVEAFLLQLKLLLVFFAQERKRGQRGNKFLRVIHGPLETFMRIT